MTITPEQLAASGSEGGHQKALFAWSALNVGTYPQLKYLFHIPNGGFRNVKEGANLKAQGVRRGVPDVMLPWPNGHYSGLWIENKKPGTENKTDGGLSDDQLAWRNYLRQVGYRVITCYSWEQARDGILNYFWMADKSYKHG